MSTLPRVSLIAAIGKNRELGFHGKLLWSLPDDLKHFKKITSGHPVIMGRKTWESLPARARPLPNRTNIVVTHHPDFDAPGAVVADSLRGAVEIAQKAIGSDEVFVIGGGQLYAEALPFSNRLYLTLINAEAEADTYFPEYKEEFRQLVIESSTGEPSHQFSIFERV